jgi:spore coat polysaccharide biosynthesis protein SpsF
MTTGLIIQAHLLSTRLDKKILRLINDKPILYHVIHRCCFSGADKVIVATTTNPDNDPIKTYIQKFKERYALNIDLYRYHGNENDLLSRYYHCAIEHKLDSIIRVTSDCVLISSDILNIMVKIFSQNKCDVLDFLDVDGLEVQCINFKSLKKVHNNAKLEYEREHIFPYVYSHPDEFNIKHLHDIKLSIDTIEDFNRLKEIMI